MTNNDPTNLPPNGARSQALMPWEVALPPLTLPPGFAGELASFIYKAAPRPVVEVSVVSALGLLAGVCGTRWQISRTGLNLYLILVALSGIGKEAMHTGISDLLAAVAKTHPEVFRFINFNQMASGPALIKAFEKDPCFVHIAGEFGDMFESIETAQPGSAQSTLRSAMKRLYTKSGINSIAGGIEYSNRDNNVASLQAVGYSMIGDTTPGTFYDAITEKAMSDGFMSRFTVVPYEGDRPNENTNRVQPWKELVDWFAAIVGLAVTNLTSTNTWIEVQEHPDAKDMLARFSLYCDSNIRGNKRESFRQMWNRAHLKALRIAGLLAVGDCPKDPTITTVHATWAIQLVLRDIALFTKKLESGEVGEGDEAMHDSLAALIKEYYTQPLPTWCVERGFNKLKLANLIPWNWLAKRTSKIRAFKKHKLGSNKALELALDEFKKAGLIAETGAADVWDKYAVKCKCFRVLEIGDSMATPGTWIEMFVQKVQSMH
jgi:hypothetical protein